MKPMSAMLIRPLNQPLLWNASCIARMPVPRQPLRRCARVSEFLRKAKVRRHFHIFKDNLRRRMRNFSVQMWVIFFVGFTSFFWLAIGTLLPWHQLDRTFIHWISTIQRLNCKILLMTQFSALTLKAIPNPLLVFRYFCLGNLYTSVDYKIRLEWMTKTKQTAAKSTRL